MNNLKNLLYIPVLASLVTISCSKKKEDPTPETQVPVTTTTNTSLDMTPSLSAVINGEKFVTNKDSLSLYGYASAPKDSSYWEYASFVTVNDTVALMIAHGVTHNALDAGFESPNTDTFKNLFKPGTYTYRTSDLRPGVAIRLNSFDETEEELSTDFGSQSGSTFTITKASGEVNGGKYMIRATITFSCKIYRKGGILHKTITNATYEGIFKNGLQFQLTK